MYCKNLSKAVNGKLKCKTKKQVITLDKCKNCSDFILVRNKPIKKVSNKRIIVTEETYNKVFKRDEGKCRLCGTSLNLHLHHIMRKRKKFDKQYRQLYNALSDIVT